MIGGIINFIGRYIKIDQKLEDYLTKHIGIVEFKKGDKLLSDGEISNSMFFCLRGCLRMFMDYDGLEKNIAFCPENKFIVAWESYIKRTPSKYTIECLEPSAVGIIDYELEQKAFKKYPKLQEFARKFKALELATYQETVATFTALSPRERYLNFLENNSDLAQRIPQYMQASYLGISAESLSRIRKRISQTQEVNSPSG